MKQEDTPPIVNPDKPTRLRREVLLLSADIAACAIAMWLALRFRFGGAIPTPHQLPYQAFLPILISLRLVAAHGFGLYDFKHKLTPADHAFAGCAAALAGVGTGYALLVLVRLYYTQWIDVSRAVVGFDAVIMALWFAASRAVMLVALTRSGYRVRAIVIGPTAVCRALAEEIRAHAPKLFVLDGIVSTDGGKGADVLGGVDQLDGILERARPGQAILTSLSGPQDQLQRVFAQCDTAGVELYLHPDITASVLASSNVTSIAGLPLAPLSPGAAIGPYQTGKRALDVAASLCGLALALPLCIAAAIGVKLTSPGPVFFSQDRVGLRGRVFRVLKFRTMTENAEAGTGPVLSSDSDPRVTRVGRVLRRFRVDEIPQLWNVLKGEMSLVGPRPERPEFQAQFVIENPLYERRLLVKPGLTGLAQIHGRYDTDYAQKLRYDLIYVNSVSLATDLRILAATIRIVLTGKGAV
ncbi:MAG: sugar transferase [Candidatus Hydrogenedentes bacterium]|nr:sugar transferase [Candidatus Hydrogenedentota bacterium]